jgi:hypothetical protein
MAWGGKRAGAGRRRGAIGLKSAALANRLDELDCDPAEALVRLGKKAEAAGDLDLAIKAFFALMPFRWPKLRAYPSRHVRRPNGIDLPSFSEQRWRYWDRL